MKVFVKEQAFLLSQQILRKASHNPHHAQKKTNTPSPWFPASKTGDSRSATDADERQQARVRRVSERAWLRLSPLAGDEATMTDSCRPVPTP
jgi:hypothetical protein